MHHPECDKFLDRHDGFDRCTCAELQAQEEGKCPTCWRRNAIEPVTDKEVVERVSRALYLVMSNAATFDSADRELLIKKRGPQYDRYAKAALAAIGARS